MNNEPFIEKVYRTMPKGTKFISTLVVVCCAVPVAMLHAMVGGKYE